jgi:hypothetical protein
MYKGFAQISQFTGCIITHKSVVLTRREVYLFCNLIAAFIIYYTARLFSALQCGSYIKKINVKKYLDIANCFLNCLGIDLMWLDHLDKFKGNLDNR